MTLRVGPIQSPSDASVVPGWNDYEFLQLERNLLTEGVIQGIGDEFEVTERGAGANMSVDVGSGRALIEIENTNVNHGKTYKVWFDNDATVNKTVTTADPTNPRKDRVVLRVDVSTDPDGNSSNIAIIEVLAGTPAGSPSAPAEPDNAITLAVIDIPASDTTISDGQITDSRPFVELDTAVLLDITRAADLASTSSGKGASMVGVEDSGANFTGTNVEDVLDEIATSLDALAAVSGSGFYGDGSDGDVTISGNTSLSRDMYYNNLTIDDTFALSPSGFKIFVAGTLTLSGTGNRITAIGGNGGAGNAGAGGTGGTGGSAGAASHSAGTLPASLAGAAGGAGGNTNSAGNNGSAGANSTFSIGISAAAAASGQGGGGSPGTGGTAGTVTTKGYGNTPHKLALWADWNSGTLTRYAGGGSAGGGGGGSGSVAGAGGGGGGSGGNGGLIFIAAKTITGTGNMSAAGGTGGAGGAGESSSPVGTGGGGGAGGTGGVIAIIYHDKTGWSGSASVAGGSGGSAGANGTGQTSGSSGTAGYSLQIAV